MAVRNTDPRYVAVLAAACIAILLVGVAVKPGVVPEEVVPPAASELPQLGRFADRRMLESISGHFSYVATLVEQSVLSLAETGQSGVVWRAGEVVTSPRLGPFPARERAAFEEGDIELPARIASPHLPYVLLQAPPNAVISERRPVRLYPWGSWLLAVWRSGEGGLRYAPGNLFGVVERSCGGFEVSEVLTNLELEPGQAGAGVFSLDGGLLAVVLDCAGTLVAVEAAALESQARESFGIQDLLPQRYGMQLADADAQELKYFGREDGVVIRETWWGHRAHEAGLLPGDMIVEVDGAPVSDLQDLGNSVLAVSAEAFELVVWRARRRVALGLQAQPLAAAAVATGGFSVPSEGLALGPVMAGSLAAGTGARAGDRLLAVNQRPARSSADVEAAFEADQGWVHVVLQRRGRMWGALVRIDE